MGSILDDDSIVHKVNSLFYEMEERRDLRRFKLQKLRESSNGDLIEGSWTVFHFLEATEGWEQLYRRMLRIGPNDMAIGNLDLAARVRKADMHLAVPIDSKHKLPLLFLDFGGHIVDEENLPQGQTISINYDELRFEYPGIGQTSPNSKSMQNQSRLFSDWEVYRYIGPQLELIRGSPMKLFLEGLVTRELIGHEWSMQRINPNTENPNIADYVFKISNQAIAFVKLRRDGILFLTSVIYGSGMVKEHKSHMRQHWQSLLDSKLISQYIQLKCRA